MQPGIVTAILVSNMHQPAKEGRNVFRVLKKGKELTTTHLCSASSMPFDHWAPPGPMRGLEGRRTWAEKKLFYGGNALLNSQDG